MSGVTAFCTSMDDTISEGTRSSAVAVNDLQTRGTGLVRRRYGIVGKVDMNNERAQGGGCFGRARGRVASVRGRW
jgi:hypothetical protein